MLRGSTDEIATTLVKPALRERVSSRRPDRKPKYLDGAE